MEYKDEELLEKRKAAAQKAVDEVKSKQLEYEMSESIFNGAIHVDEKLIEFEKKEVEQMGISIYMPKTFDVMSDEDKAALYPFGNPPKFVYVDYEIPFQLTLNKTGHKVPDEGMERFIDISAKILENHGPKSKVLGKGVVRLKDHNIGIMEVATRAMDENVHNVMFNISINDEIMMGNIHFVSKYSKRLAVVAKEMIDSIEYLEE